MAFSEKIKLLAKQKAAFRCCLCHKPFVEIHHIIPQAEGGPDSLDNAAPLCSSCHDLYGGNPEKRKIIRQMRDYWWELMENRQKRLTESPHLDEYCEIHTNSYLENDLRTTKISLYHLIFEDEGFNDSASHIHRLLKSSQDNHPNQERLLFLDIDGHRNEEGGFDHDMFELQENFLLGFLAPYFTEVYMPLATFKNDKLQRNDIPNTIEIIDNLDQSSINAAIDKGISAIWVADKYKLMKFE
jgi:hypothetical protein